MKKSSSTEFSLTSDTTMLGAYDLQKARMRNKTNKDKGIDALKRKYDDIMNLKLDDDKLSGNPWKVLLNSKKQKPDKSLSSLKKKELLQLWE